MYGLILVELPKVCPPSITSFLRMQGDFYTVGNIARRACGFRHAEGDDENPTYVLFNGSEGALIKKALKATTDRPSACSSATGGPNIVPAST